jgi:hypothetical protein
MGFEIENKILITIYDLNIKLILYLCTRIKEEKFELIATS